MRFARDCGPPPGQGRVLKGGSERLSRHRHENGLPVRETPATPRSMASPRGTPPRDDDLHLRELRGTRRIRSSSRSAASRVRGRDTRRASPYDRCDYAVSGCGSPAILAGNRSGARTGATASGGKSVGAYATVTGVHGARLPADRLVRQPTSLLSLLLTSMFVAVSVICKSETVA